jgi:hypothetical protein
MSLDGIPIIFVHFGAKKDTIRPVFPQAARSNPNSPVYLISNIADLQDEKVININSKEYSSDLAAIKKGYVHLSPNSADFEFVSLSRYAVIKSFMENKGFDKAFILDSDVLLFQDITEDFDLWKKYTASFTAACCIGYFSIEAIRSISNDIETTYTDHGSDNFLEIVKTYHSMKRSKIYAGISDMSFLYRFRKRMGEDNVGRLEYPNQGGMYDPQFNDTQRVVEDEKKNKKLYLENGKWKATLKPCFGGSPITMKSLHFQGASKGKIASFIISPVK